MHLSPRTLPGFASCFGKFGQSEMDYNLMELPLWARLCDFSLRVASNLVTFVAAPAAAISIGLLIYTYGPNFSYSTDYFSFSSVWTALRSIFRGLIVFGIGVIPAAFAAFLAVAVPTIAIASFGWTIDHYRKTKLVLARIVARRETPVSPRQRLQIIRPTPYELDYDVWDSILCHLSPRNIAKSVKILSTLALRIRMASKFFNRAAWLSCRELTFPTFSRGLDLDRIGLVLKLLSGSSGAKLRALNVETSEHDFVSEQIDYCAGISSLKKLRLKVSSHRPPGCRVMEDISNLLVNHSAWMSTRLTHLTLEFSTSATDHTFKGIEKLAAFKHLVHLRLRQIIDETTLSQLQSLEHLECALPDSVMQEGDRQILPTGLKSLVLWNGRLSPVLRTLRHLRSLKLRYFEDTYLDEEPEWQNLVEMKNLVHFSWATVLRDDGAILAREISTRLPQLQKIDFGIWEPSHIVLFDNLVSLNTYIEPDQIIQLVTLCRDDGKLRKLKRISSDSAAAWLDPVVWQKIVSPTFLWPQLEKFELLHHHRRRRDTFNDLSASWAAFCDSHTRTPGASPLKTLAAPMDLQSLSLIAETFAETIQNLHIVFPKTLRQNLSEESADSWLKVLARFPRLKSIKTSNPFPASNEAVRKYLLSMETLESVKMFLTVNNETKQLLLAMPNIERVY